MPILVKEVINTAQFATTLCDPTLQDSSDEFTKIRSLEDEAKLISILKSLGAQVVGKTNIPLRGLDVQCENPVFGTTIYPYDSSRTCEVVAVGVPFQWQPGWFHLPLGVIWVGVYVYLLLFIGITSMRCSYGKVTELRSCTTSSSVWGPAS